MENNDPGFAGLIGSSEKRAVITGFYYQEIHLIKIHPRERQTGAVKEKELTSSDELFSDFTGFLA